MITKADLIIGVTPESSEIALGDTLPSFNLAFESFKLADTSADLDTLPTIGFEASSNSPVGAYPVTLAGGLDNNYNYIFTNGTLNIVEEEVTNFIPVTVERAMTIQPPKVVDDQRLLTNSFGFNPTGIQAEPLFVEVFEVEVIGGDAIDDDATGGEDAEISGRDREEGISASSRKKLRLKIVKDIAEQFEIGG